MNKQNFTVMIAGLAKSGMEDYVKRYLIQLMEHSRQDKGCIIYNIHQSTDNPTEFMVYMIWESEEDFNDHNRKPEMQEFKKRLAKEMFEEQSPKTYWHLLGEQPAIYSYPKYLIVSYLMDNGKNVMIRPINTTDGNILQEFFRHLSSQSKHANFMETFSELSKEMLKGLTHIDYDREMVLLAIENQANKEVVIGMARYVANTDLTSCESIVVVADDWQNKGLGSRLMNSLIEVARSKGLKAMTGVILASNIDMIRLARSLGFVISNSDDPTVKVAVKVLT